MPRTKNVRSDKEGYPTLTIYDARYTVKAHFRHLYPKVVVVERCEGKANLRFIGGRVDESCVYKESTYVFKAKSIKKVFRLFVVICDSVFGILSDCAGTVERVALYICNPPKMRCHYQAWTKLRHYKREKRKNNLI